MATYNELAEGLALDLPFLRVSDFITLRADGAFVQVIQNPDSLRVELLTRGPVTADERRWLVGDGWHEPRPGQPTWTRFVGWPLWAEAARQLASSMVDAARVFVAADIGQIECDARNYETWEDIELSSLAGMRRSQ